MDTMMHHQEQTMPSNESRSDIPSRHVCLMSNPNVVFRDTTDNWALLFDPSSGQVVSINPVGVAIWALLDGSHSMDEIIRIVSNSFVGESPTLAEDIQSFITGLIEKGLIGNVCR